jgi:hypothetical protein
MTARAAAHITTANTPKKRDLRGCVVSRHYELGPVMPLISSSFAMRTPPSSGARGLQDRAIAGKPAIQHEDGLWTRTTRDRVDQRQRS